MQAPSLNGADSRPSLAAPTAIVLDTKTGEVSANRVFVRQTPTGYLCVGIGAGSRLLRAAFEQHDTTTRFDREIAARKIGIRSPLPAFHDPHLSRLALLATLSKDYNEDEPRDDRGRWTDGAVGAGAAGLLAPESTSFLAPLGRATLIALNAVADSALAAAAATAAGAAIFFGIVFLPANRNTTTQARCRSGPTSPTHSRSNQTTLRSGSAPTAARRSFSRDLQTRTASFAMTMETRLHAGSTTASWSIPTHCQAVRRLGKTTNRNFVRRRPKRTSLAERSRHFFIRSKSLGSCAALT
jgi:hypothetical protein